MSRFEIEWLLDTVNNYLVKYQKMRDDIVKKLSLIENSHGLDIVLAEELNRIKALIEDLEKEKAEYEDALRENSYTA